MSYAAAVLATGVGTLLCLLLQPVLEEELLLILLTVAVAPSAIIGGLGPSLLSTVLATIASVYLFMDPRGDFAVASATGGIHIGLFLLASVTISALGERQRRLTREARAQAAAVQHIAERYRLATDATNDAIWDWCVATGEVAWNDALATLFGWKSAIHGTGPSWWQERLHPEDRERVIESLRQTVRNRSKLNWREEYRFQRADGSYADVIDRGWVLRDAQGWAIRLIGAMLDITERKRAEASIEESELRFRQLAENIRDVFWVMDVADYRIIYVSPGIELLWGMERQAVYQDERVWDESIHPEDWPRVAEHIQRIMEGASMDIEYRILPPDGRVRWVRDRAFPVEDEAGRLYRIAGITEDITARRHGESAQRFLLDMAERLSHVTSPAVLIETVTREVSAYLDVTRCLFGEVDLDAACIRSMGCDGRGAPAQASSCPLSTMCPRTRADMDAGRVVVSCDVATDPRTAGERGERCQLEGLRAYVAVPLLRDGRWTAVLLVASDRPRVWTDIEVTLLRTVAERAWLAIENARLLEQTLAALSARDVSLRALRESDTRLSLALTAAQVVTCDWDLDSDAMRCSSGGWRALFGQPPCGVMSRGQELRRAIHPEDRARFDDSLAAAIAARGEDHHCEYRVMWPDGSVHWIEARGRLFYDQAGRAVRMIGVLVDITDHKIVEAERALRLAREQAARADAEAANRAKDEFLAMLGHELRNPLGAISNALTLLGEPAAQGAGGSQGQVEARAREVIARQVQHLAGMVDDLLDAARVTSGKIVLRRRPLELAGVVARCLSTIPGTAGHRLTTHLVPVWIEGDETRIDQIVDNLVSNALEYTPAGGAIDVSVQAADAHTAAIIVRDTGIGMAGDILPQIFELFAQGRRSLDRAQGGLGIGLTLVKRLVELHGGSIEAASEGPGRGSSFTVRLPRIAAPGCG